MTHEPRRKITGSRVAVIGGAGFLGSHLTDHLIDDRGCQVLVVDNLVAGQLEFVNRKADFVHHDITGSEEFLCKLFRNSRIEYVFNFAAWPYVVDSFSRPLHVFDVNCMGAIKVINAAQEAGCKAILQISSAELYGDHPGQTSIVKASDSIDEEYPVTPHSSYGAAKAAVDAYCQVAWKERKTPVIALRQFNCVGERETHPYVIPEIISQIAEFNETFKGCKPDDRVKPCVYLGNNSFRDFLYAGDQARIATELLERGQWGDVYNLGSETGIKIYDLAKLIGQLMGFACVVVEEDESRKRPWEIWHLQACNDKIQQATNCQRNVLVPLEEALKRTIAWYEANDRQWPWERLR